VFFYGEGCEHCEKVKPVLASLGQKYPELQVEALEIWYNKTNQQRFSEVSRQYGLVNAGIPLIIIGDTVLAGDAPIIARLEGYILAEKERLASCNTTSEEPAPPEAACMEAAGLTPQVVVVPALIDSLNPCALSVLIFLLISIAAAASRRRILIIGGSYIAAVFLFHLFMGIGIFSFVTLTGLSKAFSLLGAAVAIMLGLITLSDVVRNKETFFLSVSASGKGIMAQYIRLASIPAAFVLGILAGLLGFSCTGGIYISILALMSRNLTFASGLPYLILYNIIFILPLVLVTLLAAYGMSPKKADSWRTEHKRTLRLVIGLVLVALGIVVFLGWFG
jgi:cytochrome c biogenesis protein CcdA